MQILCSMLAVRVASLLAQAGLHLTERSLRQAVVHLNSKELERHLKGADICWTGRFEHMRISHTASEVAGAFLESSEGKESCVLLNLQAADPLGALHRAMSQAKRQQATARMRRTTKRMRTIRRVQVPPMMMKRKMMRRRRKKR